MAAGTVTHSSGCYNHPDREGVGVCVRCRQTICVECGTRIDGINYCHPCLKAGWQPLEESGQDSAGVSIVGWMLTIASFLMMAGLFGAAGLLIATYIVR